ncbi:hypothetical protein BKI52_35095 [marine bacterium AO1-C]|nr:hypothetical protein BKI52_35095 [marine bacterium AO1-C]
MKDNQKIGLEVNRLNFPSLQSISLKKTNFAASKNKQLMKFKSIVLSLCMMVGFSAKSLANAGMPGFWDVGAGGNFIPFFAKDSVHLGKIQMQSELVMVMLYPGFAVVKGEYFMQNLTNQSIQMTTGYPINSAFMNKAMTSVHMSDLYELKVKVNGKSVTVKRASSANVDAYQDQALDQVDNWYIWEAAYAPKTITKIEVYFLVNTNQAQLREGYNADYHNGFSYLLESGKAWAKNIERGRVYMQLMDTLQVKSIQGVYPFKAFKTDSKNQLVYDFVDLEPNENNNIVIRYAEQLSKFNFNKIQQQATSYYKKIDRLDSETIKQLDTKQWKTVTAADFKIYSKNGGVLVFFPLLMAYLIPVLVVVFAVIMWFRYQRRKAKK